MKWPGCCRARGNRGCGCERSHTSGPAAPGAAPGPRMSDATHSKQPSLIWRDIGDGGVQAEHDGGDETGALVTTARVVRGGNGRWTPSVFQLAKGRPRKIGTGRLRAKCVNDYFPGQVQTR